MGFKNFMILFTVVIVGVLPLFSSVSADDDITVNIYMIGEDERTRFGNSVMVAGIWHYIDITIDDQSIHFLFNFFCLDSMYLISHLRKLKILLL